MDSNNLPLPPGKVTGTGVIRDKDGNIKGTIQIEAEMTRAQFEKLLGDSKHDDSSNGGS